MPIIPTISTLYEDQHLLIINKPHDLLTTPGRGPDKQDCVIQRVLSHYPNARIIHRLDMATSGVLIIALSHAAQAAMGKLFEKRQIKKQYIAVIDGELSQESGDVQLPLICDWDNRPRQKVCYETGKFAHTLYSKIEYDTDNCCTRVCLEPLTGRSHQLRVHMLAIGHPIWGDYFYGQDGVADKSERLLLHAYKVAFIHPLTQEYVDITSEPPF
jgi:tRNA pseudouridine32 synthase/23S rRNA pseudouridine746 synthase